MCLVPSFINLVDRDQGVLDLVAIATQNPFIKDTIQDIMWNSPESDFEEVIYLLLSLNCPHPRRSRYEGASSTTLSESRYR